MSSAKELTNTQYRFVRDLLVRGVNFTDGHLDVEGAEVLLDGGYIDVESFKARRDWIE